ncbi:M14 family metallopeptidase [Reyranella sp.]|uniref:M14 family metallopeptidase n=1 Tax=Reyranella sp. TaxID=1929291 RepID=UPI00273034B0|nr:M14 family metallopeptidase [Reyranella sp.]MDP2373079.1 M14 family metallopeptidase [Reyranella sp.]
MSNIHSFAADYSEARDKFLAAARLSGARTFRYDNPTKGPKGESLSTDVARLGPDDASKVVVTISSTHGVEGYCGSGFQVDWLATIGTAGLPADTAAVFIHAINPYGFAWTRRVTEEGNDLNRNYVDHGKPYPVNDGYLEIADFLVPRDLGEAGAKAADAGLAAYRKKVGDIAYFRAVSGGQYSHPDGMFFGGGGPSWSNRTLHAITDKYLKGRADVAVIDFHTGLGPYGYGEPITHYDIDTPASRRVRAFWGESVTESKRGQTASQARDGLGHYGLNRVLLEPETRLTMCTLEFGTFDRESGQKAFRADHWLHRYGDPLGKEAGPVRAAMRRQFYPDTDDWKEAVLFRGHQITRQAIAGMQRKAN